MSRMTGKIALLTGAAGAIGLSTAKLLAERGARIVAVDLEGADWAGFCAALPEAVVIHADVTREEDWIRVVEECRKAPGVPHYFFNNAGIEGKVCPLHETTLSAFEKLMSVNVTGVFLGLKHLIPAMIANGGGAIVNTSSVAGLEGSAGVVGYVASKHAVVGITRVAAVEYGRQGIRINTVHPGFIESRMMESLEAGSGGVDMHAKLDARVPMGRHGRTEEVAALVAFLLSDEASYCHGGRYTADGGVTEA